MTKAFLSGITMLLGVFLMSSQGLAADTIPDDVRYIIEDIYGADRGQWPSPIYRDDLNNDGFADWVAQARGCQAPSQCPVELFLCKPNQAGQCVEYCYFQLSTIKEADKAISSGKCESAC